MGLIPTASLNANPSGPLARELIALSLPGYAVPVPEGFTYRYWKGEV